MQSLKKHKLLNLLLYIVKLFWVVIVLPQEKGCLSFAFCIPEYYTGWQEHREIEPIVTLLKHFQFSYVW